MLQKLRFPRVGDGDVVSDIAALVKVQEPVIHRLHVVLSAGLHLAVEKVRILLADVIANRRRRDANLADKGEAVAVGPRQSFWAIIACKLLANCVMIEFCCSAGNTL